ncbi:MAG: glycosyltransferase family 2 protein [Candidatus Berkelbacteria bacterium]|nr:glycosyltransferase family 2 protein [Candidatus Berkelbacteria bacterium]
MASKSFAVVVINYNGEKFLEKCFESLLLAQGIDDNFDIYLLDNHSSDDSASLTKRKFPKVKIIQTGGNLGFSGAYNYAHKFFKESKIDYDYYYILNNDTITTDTGIFQRIKKLFEKDENIGIINPTVLNQDGSIQFQIGDFYFLTGTTISHNRGAYESANKLAQSKWSTGAALFIRSSVFEEIGGFDDYFMYMEDVALSWKALNLGYEVVCDFGSSIVHAHDGTKKAAEFSHYYSERNRLLMYWQNLSSIFFFCFLPFFIIIRFSVILAWFILKDQNAKIALSIAKDFQLLKYFHSNPKVTHLK